MISSPGLCRRCGVLQRTAKRVRDLVRVRGSLGASLVGLAVGSLVYFHAVLLWQRIQDLSLLEPLPAARWLAALGLVVALVRLRNRDLLWRGRQGLAVWLLVLLLHVSFWSPIPAASIEGQESDAALALVLPVATAIVAAILCFRGRLPKRSRKSLPRRWLLWTVRPSLTYAVRAGHLPSLASRPPPAF